MFYNLEHPKFKLRKNGTRIVGTKNTEPSRTVQDEKENCDINHIVAKFQKTGQFTHLSTSQPLYGDFSEVPDLQEAIMQVQDAEAAFQALPAAAREKFANSPQKLYEFMADKNNYEEAVKLGLLSKKPGSIPEESNGTPGRVQTKNAKPAKKPVNDDKLNDDDEG